MSAALGYLLTWSCYGCRLHGDARGSVDRFHNVYDSPTLPPDPEHEALVRKALRYPLYHLGPERCSIVRQTIIEHSMLRRWKLHAVHPRTEHVHVVVTAPGYTPELAMEQFKSWTTRRLRAGGNLELDHPAWATHGSTEYLWTQDDIASAVHYVIARQGDPLT